ncbi:MAG: ankyrin repeat domain-containing protein [Deltaproteobacteria bacterium]|nr:MAG: ankyrin repeat domain-containing protein [Deltaproteobacteria bacterium]
MPSDLLTAAASHDLDAVQRLLADPAAHTPHDAQTALVAAAHRGAADLVECLLDANTFPLGLAPNGGLAPERWPIGETRDPACQALILEAGRRTHLALPHRWLLVAFAARWGSAQLDELLAEHGSRGGFGDIPLPIWAAQHAPASSIRLLHAYKADFRNPRRGGVDVGRAVARNLTHGADVARVLIEIGTPFTIEHLRAAAALGNTALVEVLLSLESLADARAAALDSAAYNGQLATCQALLRHGARAAASALGLAIQAEHRSVVDLLLDAGAPLDEESRDGVTPLMIAVRTGDEPLVARLIAAGADVNALAGPPFSMGRDPLTIAVFAHRIEVAHLLLDAGALVRPWERGHDALSRARRLQDAALIARLEAAPTGPTS